MTPRKNIAVLLDSSPRTWTSQEEIHLRLCRALRARGVLPVLVYAKALQPELEHRLVSGGAIIEVISYAKGPLHYFRELGKLIKRYDIGMAHICFFDYYSLIPWLSRLQGLKLVVFEELNSGMMQARSWKRQLLRLRTILTALPTTRLLAISQFIKGELVSRGINASRVIVRHLGVDEERFRPNPNIRASWSTKYRIGPEECVLSMVAVLRPFKNPDTILKACGLLASRGISFRLFVAGDGAMLPELKELSTNLGIERNVVWLGYCSDPKPVLQASDVFLLASVGEAFGLVVPEAMACGVPVVGSRSGAIPELIAHGETGLLAAPRDADSFAAAIEKLAVDTELRREMGEKARKRVLDFFTVDRDIENTMRIYEELGAFQT
ncbi:MAG: glycosyltransferase family 4 protein [Pyrinomonadaceae bacterium]|jgi:glycosyltransferase involved in cell wall biosynthesis